MEISNEITYSDPGCKAQSNGRDVEGILSKVQEVPHITDISSHTHRPNVGNFLPNKPLKDK